MMPLNTESLIKEYKKIITKVNKIVQPGNRESMSEKNTDDRDVINTGIAKARNIANELKTNTSTMVIEKNKSINFKRGIDDPLSGGKIAEVLHYGNCEEMAELTLLNILQHEALRDMEYYICKVGEDDMLPRIKEHAKEWMPNSTGGHVFVVAKIKEPDDAGSRGALRNDGKSPEMIIIDAWSKDVYKSSELLIKKEEVEEEIESSETQYSNDTQNTVSINLPQDSTSKDANGVRKLLANCNLWHIMYCWDGLKYLTIPDPFSGDRENKAKAAWETTFDNTKHPFKLVIESKRKQNLKEAKNKIPSFNPKLYLAEPYNTRKQEVKQCEMCVAEAEKTLKATYQKFMSCCDGKLLNQYMEEHNLAKSLLLLEQDRLRLAMSRVKKIESQLIKKPSWQYNSIQPNAKDAHKPIVTDVLQTKTNDIKFQ